MCTDRKVRRLGAGLGMYVVASALGCAAAGGADGFTTGSGNHAGGEAVDAGQPDEGNGGEADSGSSVFEGGGVRGGGPSSATIEAVCNTAATTLCTKIDACSHFGVVAQYGDVTTCTARYALKCTEQLTAPGTGLTPDFMQACQAAIVQQLCGNVLDGTMPAACWPQPPGQRATGAACGESGQCAASGCRKATGSYCGTCLAPAALGASCASTDCEPGLVCNSSQLCVSYGAVGASCSAQRPCTVTAVCKSGTCAVPDKLGDSCIANPSSCDALAGLACDASTLKCVAAQFSTGPCGVVDGDLLVCQDGASCVYPSKTSATGNCVAPAADGAACNTTTGPGCSAPAFCNQGVCTLPTPTTCE